MATPFYDTVNARPALTAQKPATAPAAASAFTSFTKPVTPSGGYPVPKASTGSGLTIKPQPTNPAVAAAFGTPPQTPLQDPGNNLVNQGYSEQALNLTQNRLLEDPAQGQLQTQYNAANTPTTGQNYMNQNLGTLDGAGQGDQYWNQVQGQFNDPFAGEQFTREATQNFSPTGAAGAFNDQAQARSDQFTNFQGAGNSQGQYGQSQQQLAGGTQGEQGLGGIAGQYGAIGQYNGVNNAAGQYGANASSGPMAAQSFYDSVAGQAGTTGKYSDPNLAAGQYSATQQAFGDMPLPDSADAYYDRAVQLGTQGYNNDAASRGVYGSSAALSGVGNVITDLRASQAQKTFDNQMAIEVENRNRQQLLGEQARSGDLSSLSAFGANLAGLETFGGLANAAGNQTLGQQTMLGTQARNADISATDAFNQNLQGAQTFANINSDLANTELDRNRLLGDMANNADSQALGAQQANIAGMNTLSNAASNADSAETNRYQASTSAMNNADRTGLDRLNSGVSNSLAVDANTRSDFTASQNAAAQAAGLDQSATRTAADIADRASDNDLQRLDSFNNTSQNAESQRQARQIAKITSQGNYTAAVQTALQNAGASMDKYGADAFEDWAAAEIAPALQDAGLTKEAKDKLMRDMKVMWDEAKDLA